MKHMTMPNNRLILLLVIALSLILLTSNSYASGETWSEYGSSTNNNFQSGSFKSLTFTDYTFSKGNTFQPLAVNLDKTDKNLEIIIFSGTSLYVTDDTLTTIHQATVGTLEGQPTTHEVDGNTKIIFNSDVGGTDYFMVYNWSNRTLYQEFNVTITSGNITLAGDSGVSCVLESGDNLCIYSISYNSTSGGVGLVNLDTQASSFIANPDVSRTANQYPVSADITNTGSYATVFMKESTGWAIVDTSTGITYGTGGTKDLIFPPPMFINLDGGFSEVLASQDSGTTDILGIYELDGGALAEYTFSGAFSPHAGLGVSYDNNYCAFTFGRSNTAPLLGCLNYAGSNLMSGVQLSTAFNNAKYITSADGMFITDKGLAYFNGTTALSDVGADNWVVPIDANVDGSLDLLYTESGQTKLKISNNTNDPTDIVTIRSNTGKPTCINQTVTYTLSEFSDSDNSVAYMRTRCESNESLTAWSSASTLPSVNCLYSVYGNFNVVFEVTDLAHYPTATDNITCAWSVDSGNCYEGGTGGQLVCTTDADVLDYNKYHINTSKLALNKSDIDGYQSEYFDWEGSGCNEWEVMRGVCPLWKWTMQGLEDFKNWIFATFIIFLVILMIIVVVVLFIKHPQNMG